MTTARPAELVGTNRASAKGVRPGNTRHRWERSTTTLNESARTAPLGSPRVHAVLRSAMLLWWGATSLGRGGKQCRPLGRTARHSETPDAPTAAPASTLRPAPSAWTAPRESTKARQARRRAQTARWGDTQAIWGTETSALNAPRVGFNRRRALKTAKTAPRESTGSPQEHRRRRRA